MVAAVAGEVIGCAGLRRHDCTSAELKRLYVRAGHRRRGHARVVLAAMEERAHAMGYERLILETGTAQPEAIALYEREDYTPIPGFGRYAGHAGNRCYAKVLGISGRSGECR